ncbi:PREDICTED: uncharacterized protein LOC106108737 [Papilio polytes]|uniref:uncharacterized protein LOC106108737 n=1 Tax=Papilio polytes TaxID=76194 RepID=UPI0006766CC5|nr:PREDICTED: uncharacterized protein LOC106108737 [Papilio polytes]
MTNSEQLVALTAVDQGYENLILFADDIVLLFHGDNWQQVYEHAESGLKNVTAWLDNNLLTLNATKTNYLCFSKSSNHNLVNHGLKITLHTFACNKEITKECTCNILTRAKSIRYLGVHVDDTLSWKDHITHICSRVRRLIYIFKQLRTVADVRTLILTYRALCQSILYYCITVWGGVPKSRLIDLERAQRAILKVLMRLPYRHPTTALYEESRVLSVRKLFILQSLLRLHRTTATLLIHSSKRKFRCPIPLTKTSFAQRHYNFLAPWIYNQVQAQSDTNIASLSYFTFKKYITQWLISLDYDGTESFFKNSSIKQSLQEDAAS